jgi:DNA-binding NarL/FixJ family response regulator
MKILLVEGHAIVRAGFQRLLQSRPDSRLIETSTAAEGLQLQAEHRPDVIILDLKLPDANGLTVLREMLRRDPGAMVLIFTMYENPCSLPMRLMSAPSATSPKTTTQQAC